MEVSRVVEVAVVHVFDSCVKSLKCVDPDKCLIKLKLINYGSPLKPLWEKSLDTFAKNVSCCICS